MSQPTARRWPRLSYLLFAAGCASASLTLTNFAKIPDSVQSENCQDAYDTALADCTFDDFTNNHACSKKCRVSIAEVQDVVQSECVGVSVNDENSLLYRALNGQLVDVLCVSEDEEATSTTDVASETHYNQVISTSIITKTKTTETETTTSSTSTTMAEQTTSLVLAVEESSGVVASAVSSSSAEATETSSGSGRGGDPFANNTSAGASLAVGYTTMVISALLCMVAVM